MRTLSLIAAALLIATPTTAQTRWRLEPSLKYDALCLTGVLADDPFYVTHYEKERAELDGRLTPQAHAAFKRVHEAFKADGALAGPWLALAYSASDAETLDEMIAATEKPAAMRAAFARTTYWDDGAWQRFERLRPDLLIMLRWYRDSGFETYWAQRAGGPSQARARELAPKLAAADVVPTIERAIGRKLESDEITVYATRFCRPHGIRITGTRFLTDVMYGDDRVMAIIGATAIHEMMHPPFDPKDPRVKALIELLRQDPFVFGRWQAHDPKYGYNSFEGYVDENMVKALDQLIGEQVGIVYFTDADQRWAQADDGMHVLAGAIYQLMKRENFLAGDEDATAFLDRMAREGKLAPGRIEPLLSDKARGVK
ncbi:hypothetical protein [Caulobacter sp. 17J65-9]|uniref:hypothetical protein n=1 Tax=Caulobacter sp. 17J65-9 TaxID=2709382 RepID=UPI0013CA5D19|nr:hypothetical protein [Caulobacter sp. 17J65-9]NEX94287.1 hypothetical protein [Caulobacter sp. 17J65-9]